MTVSYLDEFDETASLREQAFFWWLLLNEEGATAADRRAFTEWVGRSPERIGAYLETVWLTKGLESKKTRWPERPIKEVIDEARASSAEVVSLARSPAELAAGREQIRRRRSVWRRRLTPRSLRVAVFLLAIALVLGYEGLKPERYQTMLGEQRSVVLKDGSVVTLNTSSKVEVQMDKGRRFVKLLSGEALFQVAHDAARPFDVAAGEATVRAVGTRFDINLASNRTVVTVVEGKVAVLGAQARQEPAVSEGRSLEAGEQITVAARTASKPVRANIATVTAWTQRRLVFKDQPLSEVAAEFNRYNQRTIEIQSPELRTQEVTGVFQANDPDALIAFISRIPDVAVERSADDRHYVVTESGPGGDSR